MEKSNLLFESMLALALGLFLAVYTSGLFTFLIFTVFFEYYVFASSELNGIENSSSERVLINVVYLFGWVVGRFLLIRETGFETFIDNCKLCYETFPN